MVEQADSKLPLPSSGVALPRPMVRLNTNRSNVNYGLSNKMYAKKDAQTPFSFESGEYVVKSSSNRVFQPNSSLSSESASENNILPQAEPDAAAAVANPTVDVPIQ